MLRVLYPSFLLSFCLLLAAPLAEVVRDINKFSNNTMAQLLALSWAAQRPGATTVEPGAALQQWAHSRLGGTGLRIENGSGLSRDQRLTAEQVATLLKQAWASPVLPELMASLPVAGAPDGVLGAGGAGAAISTG